MPLDGVVLALVGIPAAAALAVGTVVYLVGALLLGEAPSGGDWIGVGAFGGLSCVILWIARRAYLRARGGSKEGQAWLAKLVPVLVVVGAVGGGWASYNITSGHAADLREHARSICERLGLDDKATLDRCIPLEIACEVDARRQRDERLRSGRGGYRPDGFDQQPEVICTKAKLAR